MYTILKIVFRRLSDAVIRKKKYTISNTVMIPTVKKKMSNETLLLFIQIVLVDISI